MHWQQFIGSSEQLGESKVTDRSLTSVETIASDVDFAGVDCMYRIPQHARQIAAALSSVKSVKDCHGTRVHRYQGTE